jgi:hypothetical protein
VTVDVFKGNGDGELIFQDLDSADEIGVLDRGRNFLPNALTMTDAAAIITTKSDHSLHYVMEGAEGHETQKHCMLTL